MVLLTAIILGFILDFIFGDPRWLPHPICFIGKLISITEKAVRRFCGEKPEGLLMGGFVLVNGNLCRAVFYFNAGRNVQPGTGVCR